MECAGEERWKPTGEGSWRMIKKMGMIGGFRPRFECSQSLLIPQALGPKAHQKVSWFRTISDLARKSLEVSYSWAIPRHKTLMAAQ